MAKRHTQKQRIAHSQAQAAWDDAYAKRRAPRKTAGSDDRSVSRMNGLPFHFTKGYRGAKS